jgi:hypothetical protein
MFGLHLRRNLRIVGATVALTLVTMLVACAASERQWLDEQGNVAALEYQGAEHCGLQSARFLLVGPPDGSDYRQYVRDPSGVLRDDGDLLGEYERAAELPANATDTRITRDGLTLWSIPGDEAIYVVAHDHVEKWPRAASGVACA